MTDWPERLLHDCAAGALKSSAAVKMEMEKRCLKAIIAAASMIAGSMQKGGTVFLCGNGGSAADSQHIAAEFVVRLTGDRDRRALPAIALTTDTSILTACANDYGFDRVFARQVEALGVKGDILICYSTSGNSQNVVKAAEAAKKQGMKCIGLLGENPGLVGPLMDISIHIPSSQTRLVQEGHITAGHIIVDLVEILLFDEALD